MCVAHFRSSFFLFYLSFSIFPAIIKLQLLPCHGKSKLRVLSCKRTNLKKREVEQKTKNLMMPRSRTNFMQQQKHFHNKNNNDSSGYNFHFISRINALSHPKKKYKKLLHKDMKGTKKVKKRNRIKRKKSRNPQPAGHIY